MVSLALPFLPFGSSGGGFWRPLRYRLFSIQRTAIQSPPQSPDGIAENAILIFHLLTLDV